MYAGLAMRGKVLVVDDQIRARRMLVEELQEAGFDVREAPDGREGWRVFQEYEPQVVISDVVMPAEDGLGLLERIRAESDVPVLLFTAFGTAEAAIHAFKHGADDFITATEDDPGKLVDMVAAAIGCPNASDTAGIIERTIAGNSPAIAQLRRRIAGIAPLKAPVLIAGERGSGRNLVAGLLHELGSRRDGELVRLHPHRASLDEGVAPATVYLDRVDEMSPESQREWARFLEVSSSESFRSGPRIVASTTSRTADLARDTFSDGIGRILLRFTLELPGLKEIPEDVGPIAQSIAIQVGRTAGRRLRLSPAALRFVREQRWDANAAGIQRLIQQAIPYASGRFVRVQDLRNAVTDSTESLDAIRAHRDSRERDRLVELLRASGGNVTRVAEAFGKSRAAVYRMIEKHQVPLKRPPS